MTELSRKPGIIAVLAVIFSAVLLAAPAHAEEPITTTHVRLQSLDKSTARTKTFEAAVGETVQFGPLYIKVQTCRKNAPIETPESAAFLQVWEVLPDQSSEWVFSGWMFASSPSLSAMDHPIYDVWVLECFGGESEDNPEPAQEGLAPPDQMDGDGAQENENQSEEESGTQDSRTLQDIFDTLQP